MCWKSIILIALISIAIPLVTPAIWGKPMYHLIHERAELLDYNHSLVTDDVYFSFGKFNRTNFALNVSFNLLQDIPDTDKKILVRVFIDKLFGTEFKRTGTMLSMNLCKALKKNLFGFQESLKAAGNMEKAACNAVKGFYYLTNFMPNDQAFPRYLPFGSYRIDLNLIHEDETKLFRLFWFARVERLPK